jgi:MoxR-like ATPase
MNACVNAALYIAIQCGVTGLAWGTTGVGKSATIKCLAEALKRKFFCFIPSMHMPEDIGGIPYIDVKKKFAEMIHMMWIKALEEPGWMLMIDEVTTARQEMKPTLLTVCNERRIGNHVFHPDTIIVAAANPPEFAPNGAPLEPSMCNRFYHHDWEMPFDTWYKGMMNGGKFEAPANLPIVGDFSTYTSKWMAIIGSLCHAHPEIRETHRIPDSGNAFPSPRTWEALANCLAGTEKVGLIDSDVPEQLALGLVGREACDIFLQYYSSRDLYDVNEVLDDPSIVSYSSDRIDQLIYLPVGVLGQLKQEGKKASKKRIDNGFEVLVSMCENGMIENAAPVISDLRKEFPEYKIPPKVASRYGKVAISLGGDA